MSPSDQGYGYSANDNRTSVTKDGVTTEATYDAAFLIDSTIELGKACFG